jgi:hypothetical protein
MDTQHYQDSIRAYPVSSRPDKDTKTPLEVVYPYLFPAEVEGGASEAH